MIQKKQMPEQAEESNASRSDARRDYAPKRTTAIVRLETSMSKEQRVGVFVDVQNMYYSAKQIYGKKVNFKEILKEAMRGRSLIRAIAYVIKADIPEEENFYNALRKIGFEVKMKDLQIFVGGQKKGDWDIGIAMDTIELSRKLDTIIIVSGDGDFVPLVEHLQRANGCRVEIIAFGKSTSNKLKDIADSYSDLDKNPRRFLLG